LTDLVFCSPCFGHSVLCSSDKELNRWLALLYFAQVLLSSVVDISRYFSKSFYRLPSSVFEYDYLCCTHTYLTLMYFVDFSAFRRFMFKINMTASVQVLNM